ncbi:MAG TPA: tetratricopeptide repeat protein, partial [Thermoanaerobaculia bacterium]|nr:tetratricopeptide repeat protein [Thermoanaerobaculia bacterium]
AESHFRKGLEGDPIHSSCHYGLARVALLRGDPAEALERLEAALEHNPTWTAPRELLAQLKDS